MTRSSKNVIEVSLLFHNFFHLTIGLQNSMTEISFN